MHAVSRWRASPWGGVNFSPSRNVGQSLDAAAQVFSREVRVVTVHSLAFVTDDLPGQRVGNPRGFQERRRCVAQAVERKSAGLSGDGPAVALPFVCAWSDETSLGQNVVKAV